LARKPTLRKPNHGKGILSIKPRLKRVYDCVGLLYSFIVLLHDICVLPRPYIDFISQHSAATTETHPNDIVKKIKRENKKLKYKIKANTH